MAALGRFPSFVVALFVPVQRPVLRKAAVMLNNQAGDHWDHNNNVDLRRLKRRNVAKIM